MQAYGGIFRHFSSLSLSEAGVRLPSSSSSGSKRLVVMPIASATYSMSDAELESRGFRVHRTPSGLDIPALNDVFARVGFPRRDPARIRRALDHAGGAVVWVEEKKKKKAGGDDEEVEAAGSPVAFARATGDGVFNAVVWDVVVEPSLQGIGLGRAVMERLVAELRRKGVSNIALYAEPRVVGFYRPLGFAADPDGIKGMVYSRKNQQKKR